MSVSVPEGFHYETKYVVLSFLGMQSHTHTAEGDAPSDNDWRSKVREQLDEAMLQLDEEISASFCRTGFDRYTSPVFSPSEPYNSIQASLESAGGRVAQDLRAHLDNMLNVLLSQPLDYDIFRTAVQELAAHTQAGWNKVVVPLLLLKSLCLEGHPLETLLALGVHYLEEVEADYIIQQGGWGSVFSLEENDTDVIIAGDSKDIYILTSEQESLPGSLQGLDSWTQVGSMEPEDIKSMEGMECSENNSSNSDIVHVEREELLEAGHEDELHESIMHILGGGNDEILHTRMEVLMCVEKSLDVEGLPYLLDDEQIRVAHADYPISSPECPTFSPECPIVSPDYPILSPDCPGLSPDYPILSPDYPLLSPEFSILSAALEGSRYGQIASESKPFAQIQSEGPPFAQIAPEAPPLPQIAPEAPPLHQIASEVQTLPQIASEVPPHAQIASEASAPFCEVTEVLPTNQELPPALKPVVKQTSDAAGYTEEPQVKAAPLVQTSPGSPEPSEPELSPAVLLSGAALVAIAALVYGILVLRKK